MVNCMTKILCLLIVTMVMVGCAHKVIDRDFEKEEQDYIKQYGKAANDPLWQAPTANDLLAGEEDGVRITIHKGASDQTKDDILLQNWYAVLTNDNDKPKCVNVAWKLMDFELITESPDYLFVKGHETKISYAHLKQKVWEMDGIRLALPASGYIQAMDVVSPKKDAKPGQECDFVDEKVKEE